MHLVGDRLNTAQALGTFATLLDAATQVAKVVFATQVVVVIATQAVDFAQSVEVSRLADSDMPMVSFNDNIEVRFAEDTLHMKEVSFADTSVAVAGNTLFARVVEFVRAFFAVVQVFVEALVLVHIVLESSRSRLLFFSQSV
jgi:hypothetical protein